MHRLSRSTARLLGVLSLLLVGSGCPSVGHKRLSSDRFNYNAAIARSRDEQMLLNIVRMKYLDLPDFLAVSSVITSYTFDGSLGVSGTALSDGGPDLIGGGGNVGYSERPTITYSPLDGREFAIRLLTPIPIDVIFGLGQSGWPTDLLLNIALQRMNGVENMSFSQVPSPGDFDREAQFELERQKLERFQLMIRSIVMLGRYGVTEVLREGDYDEDPHRTLLLRFEPEVSGDMQAVLEELLALLELDPEREEFHITSRSTGRAAHEITIQTRSLLAIMSFLAFAIEVPEEHRAAGRVVQLPEDLADGIRARIPIRILSSAERPADASVTVKYRGHWFYVEDTDIQSKRTFASVLALFQLQAPSAGGAAPLLTLPAGG